MFYLFSHCLELLQARLVASLLHVTLLGYNDNMGLVASCIRCQTPDPGIAGLSTARVKIFLFWLFCHCSDLLQAALVASLLHST